MEDCWADVMWRRLTDMWPSHHGQGGKSGNYLTSGDLYQDGDEKQMGLLLSAFCRWRFALCTPVTDSKLKLKLKLRF